MPPPALMTSAPPTPSMTSLPEPPVMTLMPDVPPIVIPVDSAEASTFWKFETVAVSPVVWSELARLTVVAARRIRVLVPVLPSIDTSEL